MNKKKVIIGSGIIILVVLVLLWVFVLNGKTGTGSGDTAMNFQGVEAVPGAVAIKVEGPSVAEPERIQTIRSALEGVVVSVKEEGDSVSEGDILVSFDEDDKQIAIKQAEINLSKTRLTRDKSKDLLKKALTDFEGKKKLLAGGAIPADQVDTAETTVDNARYTLQAAELDLSQALLSLEVAEKNLENMKVRSPFSGIVLSSTLVPGDMVSKGAPLITIADISKIKLTAEIDEFDIGKVQKGQKVSIISDSLGDRVLSSSVYSISPGAEVVNNISIFRVSTIVDNKTGILKPGMSADISILINSDRGLIVPSKAVSSVRTRSYVKIFENGEIKTKKITIGADNGINVVVLDGLKEGEIVVVPQVSGFSLSNSSDTTGSSVIPISIPGVRK